MARPSRRDKPTVVGKVLDVAQQNQTSRDELIHSDRWRTPIIADLVLGTIVFVVGLTLAIVWQPIIGGGIGALGLLYDSLAIRRWKQWARLRADAAADTGR